MNNDNNNNNGENWSWRRAAVTANQHWRRSRAIERLNKQRNATANSGNCTYNNSSNSSSEINDNTKPLAEAGVCDASAYVGTRCPSKWQQSVATATTTIIHTCAYTGVLYQVRLSRTYTHTYIHSWTLRATLLFCPQK